MPTKRKRGQRRPAVPDFGTWPTPRTLGDLREAFLLTTSYSTHPSWRSTVGKLSLLVSKQTDPHQVQLSEARGLLDRWEKHVDTLVKQEHISSSTAGQYRSRIRRLIKWSLLHLNRPDRGKQGHQLDHLTQLDAESYLYIDQLAHAGRHKEHRALKRLFLFMEKKGYKLTDLPQQSLQITEEFGLHLSTSTLQPKTWKNYYWEACRGIKWLQSNSTLSEFTMYNLNSNPSYRLPWQQISNRTLHRAISRFYRLACSTSKKARKEWFWRAVKPITRDQNLLHVERFIGWQVHLQGWDIKDDTLETVFSRERLKDYASFYDKRHPNAESRGRNSIFAALQVFTERALGLSTDRFRRLVNPKAQPRPRIDQRRTMAQWQAIGQEIDRRRRKTRYPSQKLSLERFWIFFHLMQASLLRINALLQARVDHLELEDKRYILLVPPENSKQTRRINDQWRRIPLPENLTQAIERYVGEIRPQIIGKRHIPYLFPVSKGRSHPVPRQFITQQLKDCDQSVHGVPRAQTTSFHMMRNTATVALIRKENAHGAYKASKALGHASTNTTRKHYADVHGSMLVRSDWQLSELIDKEEITDQDLADIVEILKRDENEWAVLMQALNPKAERI
jgi:site-specific recombinase XerD